VTHWTSGTVKEIRYHGSYERFLLQARVSLEVGAKHRLYELRPGNTQEQKARISTKAELERSFEFVDNTVETAESLQTLFLYPEDTTPNSTPVRKVVAKVTLTTMTALFTRTRFKIGTASAESVERLMH